MVAHHVSFLIIGCLKNMKIEDLLVHLLALEITLDLAHHMVVVIHLTVHLSARHTVAVLEAVLVLAWDPPQMRKVIQYNKFKDGVH